MPVHSGHLNTGRGCLRDAANRLSIVVLRDGTTSLAENGEYALTRVCIHDEVSLPRPAHVHAEVCSLVCRRLSAFNPLPQFFSAVLRATVLGVLSPTVHEDIDLSRVASQTRVLAETDCRAPSKGLSFRTRVQLSEESPAQWLTIERGAFEAPIWLLDNHDVDGACKLRGYICERVSDGHPSSDCPALQKKYR